MTTDVVSREKIFEESGGDGRVVFPGDDVGSASEFLAGSGTYLCGDKVKASLLGELVCVPVQLEGVTGGGDAAGSGKTSTATGVLHVLSAARESSKDAVIDIGDTVTGRVVRISTNQVGR